MNTAVSPAPPHQGCFSGEMSALEWQKCHINDINLLIIYITDLEVWGFKGIFDSPSCWGCHT